MMMNLAAVNFAGGWGEKRRVIYHPHRHHHHNHLIEITSRDMLDDVLDVYEVWSLSHCFISNLMLTEWLKYLDPSRCQ